MNLEQMEEINLLLGELKEQPSDTDLLNKIALYYYENPSMQSRGNEELIYLKLAYLTKKTVKSSHNLAWYLYFEMGEQDKAINIQKECVDLNPNSYMPYYLYGYMLLEKGSYTDAIINLKKSNNISSRRDITHNIGYCYFKLGNYQESLNYFKSSSNEKDIENKSLFNQALSAYKTGNSNLFNSISKSLFDRINYKNHSYISGYEIAYLFYLAGNYKYAVKSYLNQGLEGIDLLCWEEISYSLFLVNHNLWEELILEKISQLLEHLNEVQTNHEDWEDYSDQEKEKKISELQSEIELRRELVISGMKKPKLRIDRNIEIEYCGCLLFDCRRHGNEKDD